MRMLNTEQVTRIQEYGLKKFRWARGNVMNRIRRLLDMYKEITYESIRQIRPGDSYYENDNWVKITINNSRTINREGRNNIKPLCN